MRTHRARRGSTRCSISQASASRARSATRSRNFVERYFGQVDPEDLAERPPADLYGAALSHWNFARKRDARPRAGARVQSDARGARLAVDAHDHRDRQRRHAVPRRLGDDGGQPPRADAAPHHPSAARWSMRDADGTLAGIGAEGAPTARRESFIHVEVDRMTRSGATRSARRRRRARARRRARWPSTTGRRCATACEAIVAELDARPPPLPAEELAEGKAFLQLARRRSFHVPRLPLPRPRRRSTARTRCGSSPVRASGILRESPGQGRRGELRRAAARSARLRAPARAPDHHQGERALDRASAGLSRLRRRQAFRRQRRGAAASTASSVFTRRRPTAPIRPRSRCCGARRPNVVARAGLAPGSHAGKALSTSSTTIRATSCSRPTEDDLLRTAMGILHLGDRQRFRLFVRRDPFERFLVVPHLRAARELHDRAAPEVAGDPAAGLQRHERRVQRPPVRVGAGARP